jgi:AcrR family transcriptional regulator
MRVDAPRRRAASEATRVRLLSAARDLFLERGYDATPVRKIADKSGVTIGAFYGHFASKQAVLFEVVRAMNGSKKGRQSSFPTPAHRALVLTVASFAHGDVEAAMVLRQALYTLASGAEGSLDTAKAGEMLVKLAR